MSKNGHGGARPGSGSKPTPINIDRVVSLRAQGYSYAAIGERLGVDGQVVNRAHKRHLKEQEGKKNG